VKAYDPYMFSKIIFSDETWVQLTSYVNSQNTNIWLEENSHAAHKTPLHPLKIGVWCAVSHCNIFGLIFFENTINLNCHVDIRSKFMNSSDIFLRRKLAKHGSNKTAQVTMHKLSLLFGD
jgi:hypothetical protein